MKKLFGISVLIFCLSLNGWSQRTQRLNTELEQDPNVQLQKFTQFYRYLNQSYIDTVNNFQLVEKAIKDILAELDPHSSYISPEEMIEVTQSFEGKFSGIGVQINSMNDTIRVAGVITGGPSEKVGILPNDRIISVEGKNIVGMAQTEVVKHLRGTKGTEVNIEVMRYGEPDVLSFRIIRDDISIETIDAAYMPTPTTGYIRVNRFAQTTMREFREAFSKFNNPDALILDLRGNGGGLLGQAIEMANFFLPKGSVIVSTEGRLVPDESYRALQQGTYLNGKVVVLIDDFSASASEIVSGALQDWDRAVIVGHRSFGKGLVQRQFSLIDGSAVNITISRYLTPTGRAIQRPFEAGKGTDYYESFAGRFESGFVDTLQTADSLRYTTLRLGKNVYGGGGIYPDYYIPSDTTGYTDYLSSLIRKGIIYEYSNSYMDQHRTELLKQYPDVEIFSSNYRVTAQMINELVDLAQRREINVNTEQLEVSRTNIEKRLKTYIARSLWGDSEAYQISNEDDPVMNKALEIILNWNREANGIATVDI